MSTREIEHHVKQIYGVGISPQLVSRDTGQLHRICSKSRPRMKR